MKKRMKTVLCLGLCALLTLPVYAYKHSYGNAGSIRVDAYLNSTSSSMYAGTETSGTPYNVYVSAFCKGVDDNTLGYDDVSNNNYENGVKIANCNYSVAEVHIDPSMAINSARSSHHAYEAVYDSATGKYVKGQGFSDVLSE